MMASSPVLPSNIKILLRFREELAPVAADYLWRCSELLLRGSPEVRVQILSTIELYERAEQADPTEWEDR